MPRRVVVFAVSPSEDAVSWLGGGGTACRNGPFATGGGGGTVPRIKLLKTGQLAAHRRTVCREFRIDVRLAVPVIHQSLVKPNIRPAIDRIVEFGEESVRDAIGYVASHRARGKVVIKL